MTLTLRDIQSTEERWWIFTFTNSQEHAGHYVKIRGTYSSAREKMLEAYDTHWGFQYTEKEWNDWVEEAERYNLPVETLLEVIE